MSFLCPDCSTPKSLRIVSKLELPPDSRSDEITLQVVECSHCGFEGIGVYEESRRGSLDDDSFDHFGYYVDRDDLDDVKKAIKRCPKPGNWRCGCAAHRRFGRRDEAGRWNGLVDIDLKGTFVIRF